MNHPIPNGLVQRTQQPVEFVDEVGGLYFRAICLANVGDTVPQHVHDYDHVTLISSGAARVWVDGRHLGDFKGFHALEVKANREHLFQALEPNTRLACVHQMSAEAYAGKVGG